MDVFDIIDLQECPICLGAGLLEEENGRAYYVMCMDCGGHTADVEFRNEAERLEAAKAVAHLWNIGKVMKDGVGE